MQKCSKVQGGKQCRHKSNISIFGILFTLNSPGCCLLQESVELLAAVASQANGVCYVWPSTLFVLMALPYLWLRGPHLWLRGPCTFLCHQFPFPIFVSVLSPVQQCRFYTSNLLVKSLPSGRRLKEVFQGF